MRDDFQLPRATTYICPVFRPSTRGYIGREPALILLGGSPVKKSLFESHMRRLKYGAIRIVHIPSSTLLSSREDGKEVSSHSEYDNLLDSIRELLSTFTVVGLIPLIDSIVPAVDILNRKLNLFGNDCSTSYLRCDKYNMQRSLDSCGLKSVLSFRVSSLEESISVWVEKFGRGDVVMKPPRSGGSDGVRICRSESEVQSYFATFWNKLNLEKLRNTDIVMQKYLKGYNTEFIVNTVSYKGNHLVTDIWKSGSKRSQCDGLFLYDYQELVWSHLSGGPAGESLPISPVLDYTYSVLDAVGVEYGASHIELAAIVDYPRKQINEVVLIEINPRVAGEIRTGNELIPGWTHQDQIYWLLMSMIEPDRFLASRKREQNHHPVPVLSSLSGSQCHVVALFLRNRKAVANRLSAKILWRIRTELQSFARFGRGLAWINDIRSLDELLSHKQRLIAPRTVDLITSPGVILLVGPSAFHDMQIIRNFECHYLYM